MNLIHRAFIYDFLYVLADSLIKKHNPCNIQVSRSGLATCHIDLGICCSECRYLSIRGCTVTCLGCKLAICGKARLFNPDVSTKLQKMLSIAYTYTNLIHIRTPRQEIFQYLRERGTKW